MDSAGHRLPVAHIPLWTGSLLARGDACPPPVFPLRSGGLKQRRVQEVTTVKPSALPNALHKRSRISEWQLHTDCIRGHAVSVLHSPCQIDLVQSNRVLLRQSDEHDRSNLDEGVQVEDQAKDAQDGHVIDSLHAVQSCDMQPEQRFGGAVRGSNAGLALGSRFVEGLLSVVETSRRSGRNIFVGLTAAEAHFCREPPPPLLASA